MLPFRTFIRLLLFVVSALVMSSGFVHAQYWIPDTVGLSGPVGSIAIAANGDIFAGADYNGNGGAITTAGVYHLVNNSTSWTKCTNPSYKGDGYTLGPVYGINPKGKNANGDVFVGSTGSSVEWLSTDLGSTWTNWVMDTSNPYDYNVLAFAYTSPGKYGELIIATGSTGLQYSSGDGVRGSWSEGGDLNTDGNYGGMAPTFVTATPSNAILLGDAAEIDTASGIDGSYFYMVNGAPQLGNGIGFASNKAGLRVIGGTNGLYFTSKYAQYLAPIYPPGVISGQSAYSFLVGSEHGGNGLAVSASGEIFAAPTTGGISMSPDNGQTWTDISSGLTTDTVNALAFNPNGELFAATNNGVFRFNPSGSGVKAGNAPASLTLEQNTPNPVSSNTSIGFTVAESGPVSIHVFDATGREVATVANGFYATGSYSVSYDASKLPVGAYYYRIEADGQIASRMFVVEH
jgi:hypothetical protein